MGCANSNLANVDKAEPASAVQTVAVAPKGSRVSTELSATLQQQQAIRVGSAKSGVLHFTSKDSSNLNALQFSTTADDMDIAADAVSPQHILVSPGSKRRASAGGVPANENSGNISQTLKSNQRLQAFAAPGSPRHMSASNSFSNTGSQGKARIVPVAVSGGGGPHASTNQVITQWLLLFSVPICEVVFAPGVLQTARRPWWGSECMPLWSVINECRVWLSIGKCCH